MRKIQALAILTTLALGTVALADPGGHGRGKLERLDANKDGKVTLAEMKSEASQRFAQLDADKNGRVVKEELEKHHEQMRAQWAQKHAEKRAAAGGDAKAEKDGDCHGRKGAGKGMAGHFFSKMDGNGDGAVDAKEFASHVEQRFARMDENGDKVLAGAELEHRRGKHFRGKHGHKGHDRAGDNTGAAGSAATPR